MCFFLTDYTECIVPALLCSRLPYRCGLYVLPELVHGGVGDAHVSEHPFQFGGELTATFCLQGRTTHNNDRSGSDRVEKGGTY